MNEDDLTAAYMSGLYDGKKAAQREWVGLTDEEIRDCNNAEEGYVFMWREDLEDGGLPFARAIEAKLKEKNT